jgi:hypothetical protein
MPTTEQAIWYHVVTVFSLVTFKLAVLLVGYLIARLGHDLLIKGVTGQFKFHSTLGGGTADLVSASPGVFFILMATALIAIGIIKDKPFETTVTARTVQTGGEKLPVAAPESVPRPVLPAPPGGKP